MNQKKTIGTCRVCGKPIVVERTGMSPFRYTYKTLCNRCFLNELPKYAKQGKPLPDELVRVDFEVPEKDRVPVFTEEDINRAWAQAVEEVEPGQVIEKPRGMSKKDLFVIIWSCSWGILGTLLVFFNTLHPFIDMPGLVLFFNMAFLNTTASFVLIRPVRAWVNKHIIDKLP